MKRVLSTLIILLAFSTSTGVVTARAEEDEQRVVTAAPSFEEELLELERLFDEMEIFMRSLFVRAEASLAMIDTLSQRIAQHHIILQTFEGILHGYTIAIQKNRAEIMINRAKLERIALSLEGIETRLTALERVAIPVPVNVDLHQQMERLNLIAGIALIVSVGIIVFLVGGL
ncbi:hypothetical protein LM597_05430 [Candidatus Acetothermia bacterium]|nr:hypothetical protein [Candidatus Acetothermia bacterium]